MKRSMFSNVVVCMSLCLSAGLAIGQDGQPSKPSPKPSQPVKIDKPAAQPTQPGDGQAPKMKTPKGDKPQAQPQMPEMTPEQAAGMAAWEKAKTPGPAHAHMAKSAGEWNAAVSWRMAPDAPWTTESGTETRTVIMDGLFVQSEFHGTMMGSPFTGKLIEGYNNVTKKIESVWIDSMASGMMVQTGEMSSDGKTINMSGTCADPMTSQVKKVKSVITIKDDNAHTMQMFDTDPAGKEFECMKIEYTRKAASDKPARPNVPTPAPAGK